jgi:hypothetical protein
VFHPVSKFRASVSLHNSFNESELKWERVDQEYIEHLVESMPRRLQAVIDEKGGDGILYEVLNRLSHTRDTSFAHSCNYSKFDKAKEPVTCLLVFWP